MFKVGDIVRRTEDSLISRNSIKLLKGDTGVVVETNYTSRRRPGITVKYFKGITVVNMCGFLELVTEEQNVSKVD